MTSGTVDVTLGNCEAVADLFHLPTHQPVMDVSLTSDPTYATLRAPAPSIEQPMDRRDENKAVRSAGWYGAGIGGAFLAAGAGAAACASGIVDHHPVLLGAGITLLAVAVAALIVCILLVRKLGRQLPA
jgi:hypothetical protein